uniref:Uncharacterized protein n=1 Tax=Vespula pensylvanica TaxID=30213 RepID=A0A834N3H1_VESPE|nr:hypothetical protein H0235_017040 [Vespula pensylvanica]
MKNEEENKKEGAIAEQERGKARKWTLALPALLLVTLNEVHWELSVGRSKSKNSEVELVREVGTSRSLETIDRSIDSPDDDDDDDDDNKEEEKEVDDGSEIRKNKPRERLLGVSSVVSNDRR